MIFPYLDLHIAPLLAFPVKIFAFCCFECTVKVFTAFYARTLGDPVFVPHALLLRAAMYSLWRQDQLAVGDYDAIISSPGLEPQVCIALVLGYLLEPRKVHQFVADRRVVSTLVCI